MDAAISTALSISLNETPILNGTATDVITAAAVEERLQPSSFSPSQYNDVGSSPLSSRKNIDHPTMMMVKRTHSKTNTIKMIADYQAPNKVVTPTTPTHNSKKSRVSRDVLFKKAIDSSDRILLSPTSLVSMAFQNTSSIRLSDPSSPRSPRSPCSSPSMSKASKQQFLERRRLQIAAVLEQAAAVGMAVEELHNSAADISPSSLTNATREVVTSVPAAVQQPEGSMSTERPTTTCTSKAEDEDNKIAEVAAELPAHVAPATGAPTMRYRPQRRNSFVIHRNRMGMMGMGTMMFPPAPAPSFPSTAESSLFDSIPIVPRRPSQNLSFSASLASISTTTTSSKVEAASALTSSAPTMTTANESKSEEEESRSTDCGVGGDDMLPNPYLVTMLKNYGQSFQVPSLTQEAKEFYGYE